jgi:hypothetical protein
MPLFLTSLTERIIFAADEATALCAAYLAMLTPLSALSLIGMLAVRVES